MRRVPAGADGCGQGRGRVGIGRPRSVLSSLVVSDRPKPGIKFLDGERKRARGIGGSGAHAALEQARDKSESLSDVFERVYRQVNAALALALIFAGIVITLELNEGTLTIECNTDNVPIRVMQGSKTIEK